MILEFSCQELASIKSFAVKKLIKFDTLETFCFPDEKVQNILQRYMTEKVHICHVPRDMGSTSLKLVFVNKPDSAICENKYRDLILEIILASEVYNRFDTSHKHWEKFDARKENLKKRLRYFEIEHINNPFIFTTACSPEEYYEVFKDKDVNKKHKGVKKGYSNMVFENFANRINSLMNFDTFEKPSANYKEVSRLTVIDKEMQKKTVTKRKFSQINNNRFYFAEGITSLPLCHPDLKELAELKRKVGQRIERYF